MILTSQCPLSTLWELYVYCTIAGCIFSFPFPLAFFFCNFINDWTSIKQQEGLETLELGKNFKKWKKISGTDDLAAKRIEKLNDSEKKSCYAQTG